MLIKPQRTVVIQLVQARGWCVCVCLYSGGSAAEPLLLCSYY